MGWRASHAAAFVQLAVLAASQATRCPVRFANDVSGSFSGTGVDGPVRCEGWLITPGASNKREVLIVHSITLKARNVVLVDEDVLEVYVPGPAGAKLANRFSASDAIPGSWTHESHQVLILLISKATGTVVEIDYEASVEEVHDYLVMIAAFTLGSVVLTFVLVATLCMCRKRRHRAASAAVDEHAFSGEEEEQIQKALNELPTRPWEANVGETEEEECAVCCEAFQEGDLVRVLGCNHHFHVDCIDHWFAAKRRMQRTCPLCKRDPLVVVIHVPEDGLGEVTHPAGRAVSVEGIHVEGPIQAGSGQAAANQGAEPAADRAVAPSGRPLAAGLAPTTFGRSAEEVV